MNEEEFKKTKKESEISKIEYLIEMYQDKKENTKQGEENG